ncbi:transglycosylase domain-containing protein [Thalassobacillus hwangdonensis]|uniref:Transglycosylase domain-containing protein n=1 Tax=Thalassobacillus hwangdonensis TaxID=546108 RepID=A0ABW3KVV7_9BACI
MSLRKQVKAKFFAGFIRHKWPLITAFSLIGLVIIGYLFILFGGRLVVDEKALVLDAATTIETEDGTIIERMYKENRTLITSEEIPEHVKDAFIAIEDSRFYEHSGLDPQAIARAVYKDIIAMAKVEGGSTITQQLAKNLFLTNDKTWMRKTKEVMAAIYLERNYSKEEILELYLNSIYFGSGVYGIGEASHHYFNKPVTELTAAEGAVLAALPKAPNTYSPLKNPEEALKRRNVVLNRMHDLKMISTEELLQLQGTTLGAEKGERSFGTWSNSYVDLVIKEAASDYKLSREELKRGGYRLVVNMYRDIQQIAYEQFQEAKFVPGSVEGVQGAFTLIDQDSGAIVAAIGGRDFQHGQLNRVTVRRQPGSTIKPLAVYGPALMKDYDPYSMLVDRQMEFGEFAPENYDESYDGLTSMYEALVQSKNIPAVGLLDQIGIAESKKYLDKLGLPTEDKGLSIALGGLSEGYTPLQLAEAYRSFAHEGKAVDASAIVSIEDRNGKTVGSMEQKERQVFSKEVAHTMTQMLQRVITHGTGTAGTYEKALAGKTGTQQHPHVEGKNKDVWFVGFTPEYVGSVWMGYDQSDKNHYLEGGSSYPTKLMKSILTEIDKQKQLSDDFPTAEGLKELPPPIELPIITDLEVDLKVGGLSLVRGEMTWTPSSDNRVVYRIYESVPGPDVRVDEVEGTGSYTVGNLDLFEESTYYIVPYDPLTKMEGTPSNEAVLEWDL